jgi:multidrug resistance efflux pump
VRRGDVLLRLDTGRLDSEIARRKRTIEGGEEELTRLAQLQKTAERQARATRAKADAELAQAEEEVRQARERQQADVRLAEVEVESARDEESRLRRLVPARAATASDLVKATARRQEAQEKRGKARLPVDESRVAVLRRARELTDQELAVKCEELEMKRRTRQAEVDAARLELATLELERSQSVILAPRDGVVTSEEIKVGDLLEAGKPVVEIAAQGGFRFEAAVPSEEVAHLRAGMPVRVKLDACDYQKYGTIPGTVCFVSPDSAVPNGEKAAMYLVRIELEGTTVGRGDLCVEVKLGMTGQAEIITDQESLLVLLLRKIRQTISLG